MALKPGRYQLLTRLQIFHHCKISLCVCIPSLPHAILDLLYSLVLIFMPTLLHLESHSNETLLFTIAGCAVIVLSAFTDYELSLSRSIPFRVHLLFDFLTSHLLIVLP
jgi:hypothetical protein